MKTNLLTAAIVIGSVGCTSVLGGDFTVAPADASAPDGADGGADAAPDSAPDSGACVPESDTTLCMHAGKTCGSVIAKDACGASRVIASCGDCTAPKTCGATTPNVCGCAAETDAAFCTRLGKNCGQVSAPDNCGTSRTASCGSCTSPQTCGAHLANVCGDAVCTPESDAVFCSRYGRDCGTFANLDNCGTSRSAGCGTCTAPKTCGAVTSNVCGCVAETDAAFCARLGHACGPLSGADNCGASRSVTDCGSCPGTGACTPSGTCFDVGAVRGLVLWLDAAKGLTTSFNHVSKWNDQSPAHNDAVQSTSGAMPTHSNIPCFNAQQCIVFDGATQYMTIADAASLQFGTGDFLVEVVLAETNSAGKLGAVFGKNVNAAPYAGPILYVNWNQTGALASMDDNNRAASSQTGLNDGTPRVVGMWRHQLVVDVRVDGAATMAATAAIDVSAAGSAAYIGGNPIGLSGSATQAQIAEIIVVKGAVSQSDVTSIESYLKTKYGTR